MADAPAFQPQIPRAPTPSVRNDQIDLSLFLPFHIRSVQNCISITEQMMRAVAGMPVQLQIQQLSRIQRPQKLCF